MFKTTGVINEEIIKELKKYLLPPKQRAFFTGCCIVSGCFAIISIWLKVYLWLIISLLGILLFIGESIWLQNKYVKTTLARFKESTGSSEIAYSSSFVDDGILVENHATGARGILKYEVFVKLVDTKNAYSLFTKSWQFAVIFKNEFDEKQSAQFIEFLKSKPTKIKW